VSVSETVETTVSMSCDDGCDKVSFRLFLPLSTFPFSPASLLTSPREICLFSRLSLLLCPPPPPRARKLQAYNKYFLYRFFIFFIPYATLFFFLFLIFFSLIPQQNFLLQIFACALFLFFPLLCTFCHHL